MRAAGYGFMIGSAHRPRMRIWLESHPHGGYLPDDLKPGWLILNLGEDVRERVKLLTPDDFKVAPHEMWYYANHPGPSWIDQVWKAIREAEESKRPQIKEKLKRKFESCVARLHAEALHESYLIDLTKQAYRKL